MHWGIALKGGLCIEMGCTVWRGSCEIVMVLLRCITWVYFSWAAEMLWAAFEIIQVWSNTRIAMCVYSAYILIRICCCFNMLAATCVTSWVWLVPRFFFRILLYLYRLAFPFFIPSKIRFNHALTFAECSEGGSKSEIPFLAIISMYQFSCNIPFL